MRERNDRQFSSKKEMIDNVWRLEPAINQTAASGYMEPAYYS
jgi:hypothetical protein